MPTSSSRGNPVRAHRRAVWLKIIAPVALPFLALIGLCVVLAIGEATGDLESHQITVVMSVVATLFIALPMTILCLVPYFLLVMLAYLSGRGYAHAKTPLRFTRRITDKLAVKTDQLAPHVARPLVSLNVWVTRLEYSVRGWQQAPALPEQKETDDD